MGKVILVASGKGGVGKTVFTANAGAILALRGYKVVLIDMNLGLRNLDICLGLESKVVYDVADVISGVCNIKKALIKDRRFPELYLISAAQHKEQIDINTLNTKELYDDLKKSFDYILIDAPAGIDDGLVIAGAGADSAVIVTVPEYAAVRDADMLDKVLQDIGIVDKTYVVNKIMPDLIDSGLVPNLEQIAEILRPRVAGYIQFDEKIHIAANIGLPIVYLKDTYIEKNFSNIIDRIINN